jgi:hypothetical protein
VAAWVGRQAMYVQCTPLMLVLEDRGGGGGIDRVHGLHGTRHSYGATTNICRCYGAPHLPTSPVSIVCRLGSNGTPLGRTLCEVHMNGASSRVLSTFEASVYLVPPTDGILQRRDKAIAC